MKVCFKCGVLKPLSEFYAHSRMADGHLNKCRDCTKKDSKDNRRANFDHYKQYKAARARTPEARRAHRERNRLERQQHPEKVRARHTVYNALRAGKLAKQPCEKCGTINDVHAHHDDYSAPLDVRWLCARDHAILHAGEGRAF
jgi:hypothetical protein